MSIASSSLLDPKLREDLVSEIRQHLDAVEETLRKSGVSRENIDTLFRSFHSIKSLAGFLGLRCVTEWAHDAEDSLEGVRRDASFKSGGNDLLLDTCRRIERVLPPQKAPDRPLRAVSLRRLLQNVAELARSLAIESGKAVITEVTAGEDLQLDGTLLEHLTDPLLHIVRNAVDHGVEPPHVRPRRAKPASGTIRLAATYEAGSLTIQVSDDGAGMPSDVLDRIFQPGFSTAARTSMISGRGVGMDVVRRRVHLLGGSIDVRSVEGTGTTVTLIIPIGEDRAA